MTRIEYIRLSHRHTNRKIRERLQAVRTRLDAKSRWLGGAWQAVAWVLYSIVSVVSWLAPQTRDDSSRWLCTCTKALASGRTP